MRNLWRYVSIWKARKRQKGNPRGQWPNSNQCKCLGEMEVKYAHRVLIFHRQPRLHLAGKALENQHARHKCFSTMLNKRVENYCSTRTAGSAKIQQQNNYSCPIRAVAQLRGGIRICVCFCVCGWWLYGSRWVTGFPPVGYVEYFPTSFGANAITFLHTTQISFHSEWRWGKAEQHFLVADCMQQIEAPSSRRQTQIEALTYGGFPSSSPAPYPYPSQATLSGAAARSCHNMHYIAHDP